MITLTLVMIMKNESAIIRRCLESVRGIVDYIVISDTGSTDDSVRIVEEYLVEFGIGGRVYRNDWKNFGYNRTLSVRNAQEWVGSQPKIDSNTNYFLTIDCDMKIQVGEGFQKENLGVADAWMVLQKNNVINYYNLRIFRGSIPYNCRGVTHEYWEADSKLYGERIGKTDWKVDSRTHGDTLVIDDVGDGGSKGDKFSRDISLLGGALGEPDKNGIVDETCIETNETLRVRYSFYLAQSYGDSGNLDEAIKWYKKRIEGKMWVEEIYISLLRLGDIYQKKGDILQAIRDWKRAYEVLPVRAESLLRIIQHHRVAGENTLALMYLKEAIKIPYPKDCLLFIEHQVYNYRFLEELSISGFYSPKYRKYGYAAIQYFFMCPHPNLPPNILNLCNQNIPHYLQPLEWTNHVVLPLGPEIPSPFINSSSSLFRHKGGYYGTVRAVNYSISDEFRYSIRDPQGIVRTKNYWLRTNGTKIHLHEMNDKHLPKNRISHIDGLEDLKITWLTPTQPIGIAVDWERGLNNRPSIVLVHFKYADGKFNFDRTVPVVYKNETCQKNWAIFSEGGKLYAIYSHQPLIILELHPETGKADVILDTTPPVNLGDMRGSANPILLPSGEWLVLVHQVNQQKTRIYYHRLLKYSKNWKLVGVSYPFYFKKLFVEFSTSIIYSTRDDMLSIVYSTRDNTTEIVEIKEKQVPYIPLTAPGGGGEIDIANLYKWIQTMV